VRTWGQGSQFAQVRGSQSRSSMSATPSTLTALAERLELWPYERNPRTHSAD
jgi:hypothetical protein